VAGIRRALVSVSDKSGVVELCRTLAERGVILLSTGGTARALRDASLVVTDVSEYTGSPEIMDGRVKTLHPRVHGGILMRDLDSDRLELTRIGGEPIDLVIVNLYPFEATVARGAAYADAIENIDIGGPCMIRAAAKNHARVTVLVDPADYARVLAAGEAGPSDALRAELAAKAFAHTARYDAAIAQYLAQRHGS
jgi:phosphoribosylaminoimidazolecarboxamide formyltransferase / IMP cyclohydrolase